MPRFTAVVKKKSTFRTPVLQTNLKPVLVGPDGKELPKDADGAYIGTGVPKFELTKTDSVDDPLTDETGNPVTAGSPEALLRKVKEHFAADEFENVEILEVAIQETLTMRKVTGEELKKL
jgi:hypothetical protein